MKTYPPGHFTALLRKHDWPPGSVERFRLPEPKHEKLHWRKEKVLRDAKTASKALG